MRFVQVALVFALLPIPLAAQTAASGNGPTVVFEAGLGDGASVWRAVIRELDGALRTFSYDRPGYHGAPRTDAPRDPCTIASELHARLIAEHMPAPYIIAGHSLGGQYAFAFARLYPAETAGLLLVDSTPTGHWEELQREAGGVASAFDLLRALTFSRTMKREFAAQDQCLDELGTAPLGVPAIVLVRTKPDDVEGEHLLRLWHARQQSWLARTGAPELRLIQGSGHYIQRERPTVVVEALRELAQKD